MCLGALPLSAAIIPGPPPKTGNRFLFVVDMSKGMKPLAAATRQAVFDMIYTGLFEQMKKGDTYGLWTFDSQPHTGIFPMQKWNPDQPLELASNAAKFLKTQDCEGKPRVEPLMQKISAIIGLVKDVTVLVLSDASVELTGTPFDNELKAAYAAYAEERRQANQPFVTVLIAQHGEITSASVHVAGSPILLLAPADPAVTATETNRPPGSVTNTPALRPAQNPALAASSVASTNPAPAPRKIIEIRNVNKRPPATNAPPPLHAEAITSPAPHTNSVAASTPPNSPTEPLVAEGRSSLATDSHVAEAKSTPLGLQAANPRSGTHTADATAVRPAAPIAPGYGPGAMPDSVRPREGPAEAGAMVHRPPPGVSVEKPIPASTSLSAPTSVAARETALFPDTNVTERATLAVGGAPPDRSRSALGPLLIGAGLLTVALALCTLLVHRVRTGTHQPSIITQSFDRTRG